MYTFSFIVGNIGGNIIPKSVKCIHSATKVPRSASSRVCGLGFRIGFGASQGVCKDSVGFRV